MGMFSIDENCYKYFKTKEEYEEFLNTHFGVETLRDRDNFGIMSDISRYVKWDKDSQEYYIRICVGPKPDAKVIVYPTIYKYDCCGFESHAAHIFNYCPNCGRKVGKERIYKD